MGLDTVVKEYKYKMIISSAVIPDVGRSMSDSMPVCEYSRGYAEYIRVWFWLGYDNQDRIFLCGT